MVELTNYRSTTPARKCAAKWFHVPDEPQKKKIMSTAEFAEASGFPVRLIRDYCRNGLLTCWKHGEKKILIDYDLAIVEIYDLTVRRRSQPIRESAKRSNAGTQKAFLDAMKQFQ